MTDRFVIRIPPGADLAATAPLLCAGVTTFSPLQKDYNATEKVSDLPQRLSTKGAPAGFDPSIGDIAYYAPWGNLAIFYKDFGYSSGLVKLGTIDADLARLSVPGSLKVTIELAEHSDSR